MHLCNLSPALRQQIIDLLNKREHTTLDIALLLGIGEYTVVLIAKQEHLWRGARSWKRIARSKNATPGG